MTGALLFFGPTVILPGLAVLWMGALFGKPGALTTFALVAALAAAMWLVPTTGAHGPTYFMILPVPIGLGALLGLAVWFVWLGRTRQGRGGRP